MIPIAGEHQGRVVGIVFEYERLSYVNFNQARMNMDVSHEYYNSGNQTYYAIGGVIVDVVLGWYGDLVLEDSSLSQFPYKDEIAGYTNSELTNPFWAAYQDEITGMLAWDDGVDVQSRALSVFTVTRWDYGQLTAPEFRTFWYLGPGSTFQGHIRVLGYVAVNGEGAPEPAPEADYCASVSPGLGQPGGGPGAGLDLGISLPVIAKGEASCSGVGALEADLPVVGEVGFPGLQICFEPITFGVLLMFAIGINLDVMIFVMAGVMVTRWLLRS